MNSTVAAIQQWHIVDKSGQQTIKIANIVFRGKSYKHPDNPAGCDFLNCGFSFQISEASGC